jgi:hypothetical protein
VIAVTLTSPAAALVVAFTAHSASAMPSVPPLGPVLLPPAVVCGSLSLAFAVVGRLSTRLDRVDGNSEYGPADPHDQEVRERALRWSRLSCYAAALLLLLIALVMGADAFAFGNG